MGQPSFERVIFGYAKAVAAVAALSASARAGAADPLGHGVKRVRVESRELHVLSHRTGSQNVRRRLSIDDHIRQHLDPNIPPDVETGIATWTKADCVRSPQRIVVVVAKKISTAISSAKVADFVQDVALRIAK